MDMECPLESGQENMPNFRSDKDLENVTDYGAQKMTFAGPGAQNQCQQQQKESCQTIIVDIGLEDEIEARLLDSVGAQEQHQQHEDTVVDHALEDEIVVRKYDKLFNISGIKSSTSSR